MTLNDKDAKKVGIDENNKKTDKDIKISFNNTESNKTQKTNKLNKTGKTNKRNIPSKYFMENKSEQCIIEETTGLNEKTLIKDANSSKCKDNKDNRQKPKKYKPRSQISMDLLNLKATLTKINEKDLYTKNWCSAIPLSNRLYNIPQEYIQKTNFKEFWKDKCSIILKPRPYAGKVIKIMSFLNKFQKYFNTKELLTLSFQDFENGLNINENTEQISEIKQCQDKMNYLFYTFLRLLFDNNTTPATFNYFLTLSNPFRKYITMLRKNCFRWGIVKEWRYIESGGFFSPGLDKIGLLALNPGDKLVILDSLVVYLLTQCPIIHNTIQAWNHDKKDLGIQDDSFYVTRYLLEGVPQTLKSFESLCDQVQFHLERKRVNMIKKKRPMKEEFKDRCKILRECKDILNNVSSTDDKTKTLISLYEKWLSLFEGLILDNPLSNPYDNDLYTLRLLDFFVGSIPEVGEFYLPQLHIVRSSNDFNIFTDIISFSKLFEKFNSNRIDRLSLFEEFYGTVSNQFKILFYDKNRTISDLSSNDNENNNPENIYWYEISNDTKSLQLFIDKLSEFINDYMINAKLTDNECGSRFNQMKQNILNLRDYLSNIMKILKEIENSKELSGAIQPERRRLRSSSRRDSKLVIKERNEIYETDEHDIEEMQKRKGNLGR